MSESAPTIDAIVRRLDRLERHNRRLRLALAGMLAAGVALAVGHAATGEAQPGAPEKVRAKTVEAERFVVRDQNGKERAILFMDNSNPNNRRPRLRFYDENGRVRIGLSAGQGEVGMGVLHADQKIALILNVRDKDGSAAISIRDNKGVARVHLGHTGSAPQLTLNDPTGRRRAQLEVDAQKAALTLFGGNDTQKMVSGIDTFGQPVK